MHDPAWQTLRIWTPGRGCPVAGAQGVTVECFDPGPLTPFGTVRGKLPDGWRVLAKNGDGSVVAEGDAACRTCPLRLLPEDATPYAVRAAPGSVSFCLGAASAARLRSVLLALEATGQRPVVVRTVADVPWAEDGRRPAQSGGFHPWRALPHLSWCGFALWRPGLADAGRSTAHRGNAKSTTSVNSSVAASYGSTLMV